MMQRGSALRGLAFALALIAAGVAGWQYAHETVARECDRLGGFYVNQKTYICVQRNSK